jgi:hypothetical protein
MLNTLPMTPPLPDPLGLNLCAATGIPGPDRAPTGTWAGGRGRTPSTPARSLPTRGPWVPASDQSGDQG